MITKHWMKGLMYFMLLNPKRGGRNCIFKNKDSEGGGTKGRERVMGVILSTNRTLGLCQTWTVYSIINTVIS